MKLKFATLLLLLLSLSMAAHELHQTKSGQSLYLGNEGVLVESGQSKILFDPFFHNDFGIYQLVPSDMVAAIHNGEAPFNNINAVFISHAHDDHFAAQEVLTYLQNHTDVRLYAPQQAIDKLKELAGFEQISKRLSSIDLQFGDQPWQSDKFDLTVDAVRIPHAGWPGRKDIQNIVFRVTLDENVTVMHLGDADPDVNHYLPFNEHWQLKPTHQAYPPYWFFYSLEGRDILKSYLGVSESIGVHVPVKVPKLLLESGEKFFSKPGESVPIHTH